jgi:hypothetical protein
MLRRDDRLHNIVLLPHGATLMRLFSGGNKKAPQPGPLPTQNPTVCMF